MYDTVIKMATANTECFLSAECLPFQGLCHALLLPPVPGSAVRTITLSSDEERETQMPRGLVKVTELVCDGVPFVPWP